MYFSMALDDDDELSPHLLYDDDGDGGGCFQLWRTLPVAPAARHRAPASRAALLAWPPAELARYEPPAAPARGAALGLSRTRGPPVSPAPAPAPPRDAVTALVHRAFGVAAPEPRRTSGAAATGAATTTATPQHRLAVHYGFAPGPDGAPGASAVLAEAAALVTGDDALAFFVRHGAGCPVKCVTLVPRGSGGGGGGLLRSTTASSTAAAAAAASATTAARAPPYQPYELAVVPAAAAGHAERGEHWVMSCAGLVHVAPGQPTCFVSLPQWARERALHAALTALPVFRLARHRKAFRAWRANVRFARYARQRAALAAALFTWKPAFAPAARAVAATLAGLGALPLLDTGGQRHSGASFAAAQAAARGDAVKLLERELGAAARVVETVCADVAARAHAAAATTSAAPPAPSAPASPGDGGGGGGGDDDPYGDAVLVKAREARTRSMAAERAAAAAAAAALAAARDEQARLGAFVRLVDYQAVSALAQLLVAQLQALLAALTEPDARRATHGMFATTVVFTDGAGDGGESGACVRACVRAGGERDGGPERPRARARAPPALTQAPAFARPPARPPAAGPTALVFEPACDDLRAALEGVITDSVKAVSATSRLLYSRPFRELAGGLPTASGSAGVFGAPTVAGLLACSAPFAAVRGALHAKFQADFDAAAEYAHVFDAVRPIFDFQRSTDWAEYTSRGACARAREFVCGRAGGRAAAGTRARPPPPPLSRALTTHTLAPPRARLAAQSTRPPAWAATCRGSRAGTASWSACAASTCRAASTWTRSACARSWRPSRRAARTR
jgi:hypothetical protein